jgi:hypothetical protein
MIPIAEPPLCLRWLALLCRNHGTARAIKTLTLTGCLAEPLAYPSEVLSRYATRFGVRLIVHGANIHWQDREGAVFRGFLESALQSLLTEFGADYSPDKPDEVSNEPA